MNEKEILADGEVELGVGRIDVVARTQDGEVWGIEVKTGDYDTEQAHRYVESGKLDRVFIASAKELNPSDRSSYDIPELSQTRWKLSAAIDEGWYTEADVRAALKSAIPKGVLEQKIGSRSISDYVSGHASDSSKDPISLDEGVTLVQRCISFPELGVIHVPESEPYNVQSPGEAPEPEIIETAERLHREDDVEFSFSEEPWIRHNVWRVYGGIPEGHIPNNFDSDVPYRPIDLVAFTGSHDPADTVANPEANDIIGIEAKGVGSFSAGSVTDQLVEFLDTETLSKLYLALPKQIQDRAVEMVESNSDLSPVGILSVSKDGNIEKIRSATRMIPKYDGYLENHDTRKTGYGDRFPPDASEVVSPYITDEEADRLKHSDSIEYAREILPDLPWEASRQDYPIEENPTGSLKQRTELEADGSRIHVLEGTVASSWSMESGYVELLIEYFREEDCLLLNFGRNFGGYIWFSGDQIDGVMTEISALADWESMSFAGRGYVETSLWEDYNRIKVCLNQEDPDIEWIEQNVLPDLRIEAETVADVERPPEAKKPSPYYADGVESDVSVEVISKIDSLHSVSPDQPIGVFQLGDEAEGAELEFTYAQWCDFIATVHILREKQGENRELPGKQTSSWTQTRITPSGELVEDTDGIDYDSDVYR
jgi:hypothetical protein